MCMLIVVDLLRLHFVHFVRALNALVWFCGAPRRHVTVRHTSGHECDTRQVSSLKKHLSKDAFAFGQTASGCSLTCRNRTRHLSPKLFAINYWPRRTLFGCRLVCVTVCGGPEKCLCVCVNCLPVCTRSLCVFVSGSDNRFD